MQRKLVLTSDGSHTVAIPEINVTYHSAFGAIQESQHIFIEAGLNYIRNASNQTGALNIFEMGFGTGLNALLTLIEAEARQQKIYYETTELFPLEIEQVKGLNYCEQLHQPNLQKTLEQLHLCEWNREIEITPFFILKKMNTNLLNFSGNTLFNLVYFDAFAPEVQPELWTSEVFSNLYAQMQTGAALTTYCSKSIVRKTMQAAGFIVTKIPGPPGKREMVRAIKS
jgi:tRNA U34 5-methylaminomethyl-2-thiouridine-forming methyltransferase MnmC